MPDKPYKCPACGSEDTDWHDNNLDDYRDGIMYEYHTCDNCGARYVNVFKLVEQVVD